MRWENMVPPTRRPTKPDLWWTNHRRAVWTELMGIGLALGLGAMIGLALAMWRFG